jgi:16S rRNA (cytidine1402-2'-O)-methyltransferase
MRRSKCCLGRARSSVRFEGFPPRKVSQRRTYLGTLRAEPAAVVWYEAPSRVRELLGDIAAVLESRRVFVLREYTKKFEEHLIGTAVEVLAALGDPPRGEFVVVLEGAAPSDSERERVPDRVAAAMTLLLKNGVRPRLAVDALVTATGLHRNDLYALAQLLKPEE